MNQLQEARNETHVRVVLRKLTSICFAGFWAVRGPGLRSVRQDGRSRSYEVRGLQLRGQWQRAADQGLHSSEGRGEEADPFARRWSSASLYPAIRLCQLSSIAGSLCLRLGVSSLLCSTCADSAEWLPPDCERLRRRVSVASCASENEVMLCLAGSCAGRRHHLRTCGVRSQLGHAAGSGFQSPEP